MHTVLTIALGIILGAIGLAVVAVVLWAILLIVSLPSLALDSPYGYWGRMRQMLPLLFRWKWVERWSRRLY